MLCASVQEAQFDDLIEQQILRRLESCLAHFKVVVTGDPAHQLAQPGLGINLRLAFRTDLERLMRGGAGSMLMPRKSGSAPIRTDTLSLGLQAYLTR